MKRTKYIGYVCYITILCVLYKKELHLIHLFAFFCTLKGYHPLFWYRVRVIFSYVLVDEVKVFTLTRPLSELAVPNT